MHALESTHVRAEQCIRKMKYGGSQPVLMQGSDGLQYVVKFANNLQGPNLLFNESMGTELFRACALPVPTWKPILLSREFVDKTPECWMETPDGKRPPEPGICFGSLFLGGPNVRLLQILPGPYFGRIKNRNCLWLAWLLDICCEHVDNRQLLFVEDSTRYLWPWFIDMGHMFKGPNGDREGKGPIQSRYSDPRIYARIEREEVSRIMEIVRSLDADALWQVVKTLPEEWISRSALRAFSSGLHVLAKRELVQEYLLVLLKFYIPTGEFHIPRTQAAQPEVVAGAIPG